MRRALGALFLVTAACGGCRDGDASDDEGAHESYLDENQLCESLPVAPSPDWWRSASPCPDGTTFVHDRVLQATEKRCVDADGQAQGPRTAWDTDPTTRVTGHYKDGVEHGERVHWSGDEVIYREWRCLGHRHGLSIGWHGGRVSTWGIYNHSRKHGIWFKWHENGQLAREEHWKDGLQHGYFRAWDVDGRLVGSFEMRKGNGAWKKWHENGELLIEGELRNGNYHGLWRGWHEDGQLSSTGEYRNGTAVGRHQSWYPNGQLSQDEILKDGHTVEARMWEADGTEVPHPLAPE